MISTRARLIAAATLAALGIGGYVVHHSINAAQAQGALAQAPLNVQVQVPPAFIMALDDSGSMLWETLNNTRDGVYNWDDDEASFYIGTPARPRGYDDGDERYYHAFPPYGRGQVAIPPVDAFGFARSPDVNSGYFDPRIEYPTWKNADGTDFIVIDPTDAPVDPRPSGSPSKINARLNLTQEAKATANNWRFRVRKGMVIPAGTQIRSGWCGASPSNISSTGSSYESLTSSRTITSGSCDMHFSYFPATFFLEDPASLPTDYGYIAAPVAVTDPPGGRPGTLYKYEIKEVNFSSTAKYNAAMQNFANWFSFYRVRREAMIGGALNSLVGVNNMRVGWFRINDRVDVTMLDMSDLSQKQTLFDDIIADMRASGSTPNREAVQHIGNQFKRKGSNAPVQLSCQRNAGMLFTDGYINGGSPNVGNKDSGYGPPFADAYSHTMADIVIPYYYESLRPDIEQNNVPVPSACSSVPVLPALPLPAQRYLDCQRNLHMNFYGVSLGTLGNQFGVTYRPDPVDPTVVLPDPYLNPPTWESRENLNPKAVDEMWHATLNSRGAMINATTPAEITAAMRRILLTVSAGASPSGTMAMSGARIGERSLAVVPRYEATNEGTSWVGTLDAYKIGLDANGNPTETLAWKAADKLAATSLAARKSFTWYGDGNTTRLFSDSSLTDLGRFCDNPRPGMSRCTAAELSNLVPNVGAAINYFLGDTSNEVRFTDGKLRTRIDELGDTVVLGDIVNSTPVVSAPSDDYGYGRLGTHGGVDYSTSYDAYMTAKKTRHAMVYVGANDGMLHGFHGGMNHAGALDPVNGGRPMFAYIPRAVLGHMGNLLFPYKAADGGDQKFDHRYFVDGPIAVGDYYASSSWKTGLVATTGAGGRSVFAIDISNPSSFTTSSNRLWEIDDEHGTVAVRNNIGHVLGRPVIVPFKTASGAVSWKAIFGNGYNSNSGKAVLFVVDMGTGSVRMIEAVETAGSTVPTGSNGLGNIVAVDRRNAVTGAATRDGFVDTVYGADRNGALWRFDLLAASNSVTTPVFVTRSHTEGSQVYRQPILGGLVATEGRKGGVTLLFGTGSFSFTDDAGDESIQSIYGVQDTGGTATITRANLTARAITSSATTQRKLSAGAVAASGWYLDLPKGERVVSYPRVASGILFIPTYAPTVASGCSTGGDNWLYGLDTRTGGPALASVRFGTVEGSTQGADVGALLLNSAGSAPIKDVSVSVMRKPAGPAGGGAGGVDPNLPGCWMRITVPGMTDPMFVPYPCGRQSWRQLL